MEEIQMVLDMASEQMQKSISYLEKELLKIRAGRANPSMLEGIKIDYYGSLTPLQQVANVNTPDARTISIQPWEKGLIPDIEKAIMHANLGLNPQNNGEMVIINIPPLTEERRKDLVKATRHEAEEARIGIRAARKEANDELKKIDEINEDQLKDAEAEVQELTDKYSAKVEQIMERKEKDIMTV